VDSARSNGQSVRGDWPDFGNGPAHTGYQRGTVGNNPPVLLWRKDFNLGIGPSPVAVLFSMRTKPLNSGEAATVRYGSNRDVTPPTRQR
jgi:hypothetical protein